LPLVLICAVVFAWPLLWLCLWCAEFVSPRFAARLAYAKQQREAVAALQDSPVKVVYDYQVRPFDDWPQWDEKAPPPGPTWQRALFGVDFVADAQCVYGRASDAELVHIGRLTTLQKMYYITFVDITDEGVSKLTGLTNLRSLSLLNCKEISDSGLAHVRGLTSLIVLDLSYCARITDAGLANLNQLENLERLSLWHCRGLTDAGLSHLRCLKKLRYLRIDGTNVTDNGLADLEGSNLVYLNLVGTQVSREGVMRFRNAHPGCKAAWAASPFSLESPEDLYR
jgi:hypothetical protein